MMGKLLVRAKKFTTAPSFRNSVMALNLLRLGKITGDAKYLERANALFSAFSGFLENNPQSAEVLLHASFSHFLPGRNRNLRGKE